MGAEHTSLPPGGSRRGTPVPETLRSEGRGRDAQGSPPQSPLRPGPLTRPPTWWRASSTASVSGRLCSSIPGTWAALCAHFGPDSQEVVRLGGGTKPDRGRPGLLGARGFEPPPPRPSGLGLAGVRKAAGRRARATQLLRLAGVLRRVPGLRARPGAWPPPGARSPAHPARAPPPAGTIFPLAHAPGSRWASAKLCLGTMLIRQCPDGAGRGDRGRSRDPPFTPPTSRPARACAMPPLRGPLPRAENKSVGRQGREIQTLSDGARPRRSPLSAADPRENGTTLSLTAGEPGRTPRLRTLCHGREYALVFHFFSPGPFCTFSSFAVFSVLFKSSSVSS